MLKEKNPTFKKILQIVPPTELWRKLAPPTLEFVIRYPGIVPEVGGP
jgi:hypothetical protein